MDWLHHSNGMNELQEEQESMPGLQASGGLAPTTTQDLAVNTTEGREPKAGRSRRHNAGGRIREILKAQQNVSVPVRYLWKHTYT